MLWKIVDHWDIMYVVVAMGIAIHAISQHLDFYAMQVVTLSVFQVQAVVNRIRAIVVVIVVHQVNRVHKPVNDEDNTYNRRIGILCRV